ncbi:MAG: TatD family hydrolase [Nitrospinota bacterium]
MEEKLNLAWVDSHCHLEDSQFDEDRPGVVERAEKAGVKYILTFGSDIVSSRRAVQLTRTSEAVYAGVGVHPHNAQKAGKRTFATLTKLAAEPKVMAVGEVGLDYYRDHSPREVQQQVFRNQIRVAKKVGRPLVLHERDAHEDMIRILQEERAWEVRGVIHCFTGGLREAANYLDQDFYISLAGPVTFPNSTDLQNAVREIPLERLLIETDAPYLTPAPFRGRRPNEPALVVRVAEKVAGLREMPLEDLARITSYNAYELFDIPSVSPAPQMVYKIRGNLHVNLTYTCTNNCFYCPRFASDFHYGHNLKLEREPNVEEVWEAIKAFGDLKRPVTFSGYGEPCLRLDVLKEVARRVKEAGGTVRVLTNGQGNLIHGRNILPELRGLVDEIRISLHAESAEKYMKVCAPELGEKTFEGVYGFIGEAKKFIPDVEVVIPNRPLILDVQKLEKVAAEDLNVKVVRHDFAVFA